MKLKKDLILCIGALILIYCLFSGSVIEGAGQPCWAMRQWSCCRSRPTNKAEWQKKCGTGASHASLRSALNNCRTIFKKVGGAGVCRTFEDKDAGSSNSWQGKAGVWKTGGNLNKKSNKYELAKGPYAEKWMKQNPKSRGISNCGKDGKGQGWFDSNGSAVNANQVCIENGYDKMVGWGGTRGNQCSRSHDSFNRTPRGKICCSVLWRCAGDGSAARKKVKGIAIDDAPIIKYKGREYRTLLGARARAGQIWKDKSPWRAR